MLAVAFTCRQIYLEVAPIYYGENTFCPSDHERFAGYNDACQRFTEAIGLRNANTITDVSLHDPSCYSVDLCLMLLPHVKRLRFKRCERSQELKDVTSLAKRHKSVTMFYGGEVWARINGACTQNTLDGILPQGPAEQDLVCQQAAGLTLGIIQDSLSLVYTLKEMKIHCPHVSRMWLEAWNNKRSVCTLAGATHRVLPIAHTAMRNRPSKIRVILSC